MPRRDVPHARGLALPELRVQDRLLRLVTDRTQRVDAWIAAVIDRHTRPFSRPEFLKAVRALSARYVERRADAPRRRPTDSAGKRAAFAAFYAPLHLLTTLGIADGLAVRADAPLRIVDLGCGTGVVGGALALGASQDVELVGVDTDAWALAEARWNWDQLGVRGRTIRSDMVAGIGRLGADADRRVGHTLIVLGWSLNEIPASARLDLLRALAPLVDRDASLLVVEPIARTPTPWWNDWTRAFGLVGTRLDEWRLDVALPEPLRTLDEAAGFDREALTAKSLYVRRTGS